jgi:two-component system, LuxR family, sensor kinase FixL
VVAATLAQGGVLAGMQQSATVLPIFELQSLVAAFTMMGLFLGVASDERRESDERLQQSLRLAAAGEMAGAIAHEVNQPLTALGVYGESAQVMLERGVGERELKEILGKMVVEVRRTGEVMHRLRELFSSGATHLEPLEVEELLEAARRMGQRAIGKHPITLDIPPAPPLPALFVDRIQVELVLRNLLANSAQALAATPRGGSIQVMAEAAGEGSVRIRVRDDGPGIAEPTRERLFEPFVSGKPVGMGIGLAVSRSIAEAHGGTLEAVSFRPSEFHLTLPCLPSP